MDNAADAKAPLDALRQRLLSDLAAVRPFRPQRHAVWLTLLSFAGGTAALWPWLGLRADAARLGVAGLAGPSLAGLALAALLAVVAQRQLLPGIVPARVAVLGAAGAGLVLHLLTTLVVARLSPAPSFAAFDWAGLSCTAMELYLGAPAMVLLLWLARRGLCDRLAFYGLTAALAMGLTGDAVWRLFCANGAVGHVLGFHTPGLLLVALLGGTWGWLRHRRLRRLAGEAGTAAPPGP